MTTVMLLIGLAIIGFAWAASIRPSSDPVMCNNRPMEPGDTCVTWINSDVADERTYAEQQARNEARARFGRTLLLVASSALLVTGIAVIAQATIQRARANKGVSNAPGRERSPDVSSTLGGRTQAVEITVDGDGIAFRRRRAAPGTRGGWEPWSHLRWEQIAWFEAELLRFPPLEFELDESDRTEPEPDIGLYAVRAEDQRRELLWGMHELGVRELHQFETLAQRYSGRKPQIRAIDVTGPQH